MRDEYYTFPLSEVANLNKNTLEAKLLTLPIFENGTNESDT
jgi:hypothetical protein